MIQLPHPNDREIWAKVPGWGCYEVSTHGRVLSWRARGRIARDPSASGVRPMMLKQANEKGYRRVKLCQDGRGRMIYAHTLVLWAFVGEQPAGTEARHLDGNPANNSVNNLCWGTPKQNGDDRVRHGTNIRGEKHYRSRLTERDIIEIRALRKAGMMLKEIGKRFGISHVHVIRICRGDEWAHVA